MADEGGSKQLMALLTSSIGPEDGFALDRGEVTMLDTLTAIKNGFKMAIELGSRWPMAQLTSLAGPDDESHWLGKKSGLSLGC